MQGIEGFPTLCPRKAGHQLQTDLYSGSPQSSDRFPDTPGRVMTQTRRKHSGGKRLATKLNSGHSSSCKALHSRFAERVGSGRDADATCPAVGNQPGGQCEQRALKNRRQTRERATVKSDLTITAGRKHRIERRLQG